MFLNVCLSGRLPLFFFFFFTSARPVFQALWSLAVSASGTTLCLRNLCTAHCSACPCSLCLCKHAHSRLFSNSFLSSSFSKLLTCKKGLLTQLGQVHVPPHVQAAVIAKSYFCVLWVQLAAKLRWRRSCS